MTLRLFYSAAKGEFEKAMREIYKPIAAAVKVLAGAQRLFLEEGVKAQRFAR